MDEVTLCARCNAVIPPERLEAIPDTLVCVTCIEEMDGEFDRFVVPGDTSKANSLKHNYTVWNMIKIRRPITPKGDHQE